jgi:hypothetical protein
MFKTLEDAVAQMEAKFSPAGRDVAAWPVEPGASEHELEDVEQRLGLKLPDSFRSVVARYDFLKAVAGNVSMTYAETFADWLAAPNVEPVPSSMLKWWGSGALSSCASCIPVPFMLYSSGWYTLMTSSE